MLSGMWYCTQLHTTIHNYTLNTTIHNYTQLGCAASYRERFRATTLAGDGLCGAGDGLCGAAAAAVCGGDPPLPPPPPGYRVGGGKWCGVGGRGRGGFEWTGAGTAVFDGGGGLRGGGGVG